MTTWATSDMHFGHGAIIRMCRRPFHDVENQTRLLVKNWNEVVAPEDEVYILGDAIMGARASGPLERGTLDIARLLNGRKMLVPGNHDRVWAGDPGRERWLERYERVGFEIMPEQVTLETRIGPVLLCHFPYDGEEHAALEPEYGEIEPRHLEWRPVDEGLPLLHGHVHNLWRTKGRMVNVGVDVHRYYPVELDTCLDLLDVAA